AVTADLASVEVIAIAELLDGCREVLEPLFSFTRLSQVERRTTCPICLVVLIKELSEAGASFRAAFALRVCHLVERLDLAQLFDSVGFTVLIGPGAGCHAVLLDELRIRLRNRFRLGWFTGGLRGRTKCPNAIGSHPFIPIASVPHVVD